MRDLVYNSCGHSSYLSVEDQVPNNHQIRKPQVLVCMILGEMDDAPALVDAQ